MKNLLTILFSLIIITSFSQTTTYTGWTESPKKEEKVITPPDWNEFTQKEEVITSDLAANQSFTVTKTRSAINNNGDYLHGIANEFANEVGKVLKANFPSKVADVDVEILFGNGMYTLTYTATIVKCVEGHHYFFDHRGSLSTRTSKDVAGSDAEQRRNGQIQPAVASFQKAYGHGEVIARIGDGVSCGNNCHTYVSEAFIVGR
jgi:hypothetical protein